MTEFKSGFGFHNAEVNLPDNLNCKLMGTYFSVNADDSKFTKELCDLMLKHKVSRIDMSLDPFSLLKEYLNVQ